MASTTTTTTRTASYKGRTYRLMFIGATKFGRRAHLGFMDGSKDFWVSADAVTVSAGSSYTPRAAAGRAVCLCDDPTTNWCPRCDGGR